MDVAQHRHAAENDESYTQLARTLAVLAVAIAALGVWALGSETAAAGLGASEDVAAIGDAPGAAVDPTAESGPPATEDGEESDGSDGSDEPDEPDEPDDGASEEEPEPADAEDAENARADDDEDESPPDLAFVQRQLADLGYLVGSADGVRGQQTTAAVMAFQRVNDLQVDGIVGPQTLGALEDPVTPTLGDGPATRIDIDLTQQLLHLVEDGERVVTLHVSSGNGQRYDTSSGGFAYGNTPVGQFTVERRIRGVREADLGTLYDPLYFYRGWAIHGSNSVPAQPASHGCVRITRADAVWLFERVDDGIPVHLHGGQHVFTPSA
jgi:hypothetical protein